MNVRDAEWLTTENGEKRPSGSDCSFEAAAAEFEQVGIRLHVLPPGEPNGSTQEAMVQRLVHLGFEVRVELVRDDGEVLSAQLTREQVEALELQRGQIVYVRPTRQTVFG